MAGSLHQQLRRLRKETGKTQEEVAEAVDISRISYTRYESGTRSPDIFTIQRLARFFEVPIEYLVNDPEEEQRKNNEESHHQRMFVSDDEQDLIINYRQLNQESRESVHSLIKTISGSPGTKRGRRK